MAEELNDFVYHDGVHIKASALKEMAKNAGSYHLAEHYIVSLLLHAHLYHLPYLVDYVEDIRRHYQLSPYPTSGVPASSNNMPNFENRQKKQTEIVRETYRKMKQEQREQLLREGLLLLRSENMELFTKKNCWIGIYLVVRDRLDEDLKMQVFCGYNITPSDWPPTLAIGKSTLSNIGRYINSKDRNEPYYCMGNNPFKDLCEKFWGILLGLLLTKKSGKN